MLNTVVTLLVLVLLPASAMWHRRGALGLGHVVVPLAVAVLAGAAAWHFFPRERYEGFAGLAALYAFALALALGAVALAAASAAVSALVLLPYRGRSQAPVPKASRIKTRLAIFALALVFYWINPPDVTGGGGSVDEGLAILRGPATWFFVAAAVAMAMGVVAGWLGSASDAKVMTGAMALVLAGLISVAWKEGRGYPSEVEAYLSRRSQCDYFRLEKDYAVDEKRHVLDELCLNAEPQRLTLLNKYAHHARSRKALMQLAGGIGY